MNFDGCVSWNWVVSSTDDWALFLVCDDVKSHWMVIAWVRFQNVELEPW